MFNSRVPTSVFSEHDTDDEIEMVQETEDQKQARIEKRNANATEQNMPKHSTPQEKIGVVYGYKNGNGKNSRRKKNRMK